MSTFKSSIAILPHPQNEPAQPLVQGASASAGKRACQEAVMRQPPHGLRCRFGAFFSSLLALPVMDHPLRTLLYELFVVPPLRLLQRAYHWMKCI